MNRTRPQSPIDSRTQTGIRPELADEPFPLGDEFEQTTVRGRESGYLDGFVVIITEAGRRLEVELNAARLTAAGPIDEGQLSDLKIAVAAYRPKSIPRSDPSPVP